MKVGIINKFSTALLLCILLVVAIGVVYVAGQSSVYSSIYSSVHSSVHSFMQHWQQQLFADAKLYYTSDTDLRENVKKAENREIEWSQLLPENEKSILQKYHQRQPTTPTEFTDQLLLSIEAASDKEYSAAMISVNTVNTFDDQSVSISGFIVPIDYYEDNSLRNIFIVPYYGACIHFPPPPPNQIIYARLTEGFVEFELTQAYQLHGILKRGLFEDPLGTSAYILEVASIDPYYENPDDFRLH